MLLKRRLIGIDWIIMKQETDWLFHSHNNVTYFCFIKTEKFNFKKKNKCLLFFVLLFSEFFHKHQHNINNMLNKSNKNIFFFIIRNAGAVNCVGTPMLQQSPHAALCYVMLSYNYWVALSTHYTYMKIMYSKSLVLYKITVFNGALLAV